MHLKQDFIDQSETNVHFFLFDWLDLNLELTFLNFLFVLTLFQSIRENFNQLQY